MDSGLKRAGFIVGALRATPARLAAAAVIALIFAAGAFAQDTQPGADTAYVPFVVNVDAAIMAEPLGGGSSLADYPQVAAAAGEQAILRIPLPKTNSVLNGTQRQLNAPAVISNRNGKVTLNLPAQSYKNAEVSLYNVNGKRILRKKVSALGAANNISRQNIATGAYLLSVKETGGSAAITSRITHSGGGLNISVGFGNGSEGWPSAEQRQLTKRTDAGEWRITVTAVAGTYIDSVYAFRPEAGTNPQQNITLREAPLGTYLVRISSAGTGATNSGYYQPGTRVNITAGTAPAGYRFKNWTVESGGAILADANSAATSFIMPGSAVAVTAAFEANILKVTVLSAGTGALGDGDYLPGATVSISAGTLPWGYQFKNWTSSNRDVIFADANSETTTFIMPDAEVTVTAKFFLEYVYDDRDGKTYKAVTIEDKNWMAENLNYTPPDGNFWCYDNSTDSCAKYGRLYDWSTAMGLDASYNNKKWNSTARRQGICPSGWHLPSNAEWGTLVDYAGGSSVAGSRLKDSEGWNLYSGNSSTNEHGFSALPAGIRNAGGSFYNAGDIGTWWTATENGGGYAYSRYMLYNNNYVYENYGNNKGDGFSVRCVQDD